MAERTDHQRSIRLVAVLIGVAACQALDKLQLVRLVLKHLPSLVSADLPIDEFMILCNDLTHALLYLLKITWRECPRLTCLVHTKVEIVISNRSAKPKYTLFGLTVSEM